MKNLWALLVLGGCFVTGCCHSQNVKGSIETIIVDAEQKNHITLSDFSEEINIIDLNISGIDLISEISALKIYGDHIIFFDNQTSSLIAYNRKSKQPFRINNSGRGPGEIQFIADFIINELDNVIEIMDSGNRKILKFSLDGNFISESHTGFLGHYFEILDSSSYIIYANYQPNDHNSNLYVVDSAEGELLKNFLPIREGFEGFSLLYYVHFNKSGNKGLWFSEMHDNKIYSITNDTIITKYEIDFLGNNIPQSLTNLLVENPPPFNQMHYLNALSESNYCHSMHSFFKTDDLLGFLFSQKNKQKAFLQKTNKDQSIIIDKILLDNGIILEGNIPLLKEGYMYLTVNGLNMVAYREKLESKFGEAEITNQNQSNGFLSKLHRICKNATDGDNPYILEIKMIL